MTRATESAPKFHHNILYPNEFLQTVNVPSCELSVPPVIHLGDVIQRVRKLGAEEADCYFKQLVCGINYLHNTGVAHRDLKPENLLLTSDGVVKITHFSAAEWLRQPWETAADVKGSKIRCGSAEYLAPEVFLESEFDPRPVDMWAAGIIYMEMRMGKRPWGFAAECANESYDQYLRERTGLWGYRPIENLKNVSWTQSLRT
jgi:protein-serine/threonine kinase